MNKVFGIVPIVMKVLLGLVFIASAILKIIDLDQFEIYVYSYHFFSLNTSFLVARAAIIIELVLGIGLVSNTLHKLYWWGSMAMLVGYTLLLLYALHMGRTDNCHCFGDFLQFDPKQSLVSTQYLMNPQFASAGGSIEKPCFTLIARMDKMPPYLISTEQGIGINIYDTDSTMTRKIKEFMAAYGIVDIKMRMLKVSELLAIQGFPADYKLVGTQSEQKKFIGNAVEVNQSRVLCEALAEKLEEVA